MLKVPSSCAALVSDGWSRVLGCYESQGLLRSGLKMQGWGRGKVGMGWAWDFRIALLCSLEVFLHYYIPRWKNIRLSRVANSHNLWDVI